LIAYLKAREMGILYGISINLLEVFNHRLHVHLLINWKAVQGEKKRYIKCRERAMHQLGKQDGNTKYLIH